MSATLRGDLTARIEALPEVTHGPSRFGSGKSAAFSVGGKEFAHFHADDRIDVRVPRKAQRPVQDDARVIPRKNPGDWIELRFSSSVDLDWILELVELAREDAQKRARR